MDIYGYFWIFIDIYGYLWILNGSLMDLLWIFNRYLWIFLGI